ncbi:MAG: iron donor protein CyaY [Planctomycetota bacterium]|nr:iron donor protein CyaY [Planctomycetota bacterium]
MDRPTFLRLADDVIRRVEDWLEDFDPEEVDFTSADGVVKIQFPGNRTYVLNRQTATNQMWYAAGVRAWHYDLDDASGEWRCDKDGHELFGRIGETVSELLGRAVSVGEV